MPKTAAERSEIGRIGAYARLARENPRDIIAPALEGQWAKYYGQTDPLLPEHERVRRAEALRNEHMARMRQARLTNARRRREAAERERQKAQEQSEQAG
jgi:hypothetical protein